MIVRTVNNKTVDSKGNVNVGNVTSVNGILPNVNGNVTLPVLTFNNETRNIKIWTGMTTVGNGNGTWSIDYSNASFSEVKTIQVTMESSISADADKPLGTYVVSKNLTSASGKAYKVSSAGLLAAMQQIAADDGVQIHVMVIGY